MVRLKIQEVARQRGIVSASELARRTGLSFTSANWLWHGAMSASGSRSVGIFTLHRVARALGVTIADLIEETNEE